MIITLPHSLCLILGLIFYTCMGLLFIIPSMPLTVSVFLILLVGNQKWKENLKFICIALVFGLLVSLVDTSDSKLVNSISWGSLIGSLLISISFYTEIFFGGDYASISRLFPEKYNKNVAIMGYYIFKIVPEMQNRLNRIGRAYRAYGRRTFYKKKSWRIQIIIESLIVFFLESVEIFLSSERIIERRTEVSIDASRMRRSMRLRVLIIEISIMFLLIIHYVGYL